MSKESAATPGRWVMSSRRGEGGIIFYIGAIKVAIVHFVSDGSKRTYVQTMDGPVSEILPNMSAGMREMHRLLKSEPEGLT